MSFLLHWYSILGLAGVMLLIVLGFAFGVGSIVKLMADIVDAFTPYLKGFNQGVVWYFGEFWTGLSQLAHNLAIAAVIAPIAFGVWGFTHHVQSVKCQAKIEHVRKSLLPPPKKLRHVAPAPKGFFG